MQVYYDGIRRLVLSQFECGMLPADFFFDRLLPRELRPHSSNHWTPVAVASRVGGWLDEHGAASLLDIGSGSGKLCVVAALRSRARFVGLEQRSYLVDAATALAHCAEVDARVQFVHGTLSAAALPKVDAYYLYNPFGEAIYPAEMRIANDVEFGFERYRRDIAAVEDLLEASAPGTLLITFNGFGGVIPIDFERVAADRTYSSPLDLYRKSARTPQQRRAGDATG